MKRRKFLSLASAAGLALSSAEAFGYAGNLLGDETNGMKKFGLQLYTLRDDLPKDPEGVLKQVAAAGYKFVEPYTSDKGMFCGMSNKVFKKFIGDLGMKMCSVHTDVFTDYEKKVEQLAEIGVEYIIYNWEGTNRTLDEYKGFCDKFNKMGEYSKKQGVRFAFHNHDYTFKPLEGQIAQTILMDNTDPSLVYYEMDMYWVVTAGNDPVEWMKKYPNRFRLCHVKDRAKNSTEQFDSCTLGTGMIDYPTILAESKKYGMDYFIVEQEKYAGTTPLQAIKDNANYMRGLTV